MTEPETTRGEPTPPATASRTLGNMGIYVASVTLPAAAIAGILFDGEMALGVILGAAIGFANLWLLARALRGMVADPHAHRPPPGRPWALPGAILLKWPLMVLAIAVVLLYAPARPEGLAVGAMLALLGASLAARRRQR